MHGKVDIERMLISQLKQGSERAFSDLYNIYAHQLLAFCKRYVKDSEKAEEIVQDVFIALWRNREKISQDTSIRGLLFVSARRLLINAWRKMVNSPIYEEFLAFKEKDTAPDAGASIEFDEFLQIVNSEIDKLNKTQRNAIIYTRFKGMSIRETASLMGLSEQTIKNQVTLGLNKLRQALGLNCIMLSFLLFMDWPK